MPFADPKDREVAEKVLRALQSDKYKTKNYLFLLPFDTSQTPGYLETIGKPLDLQSVSNNLQNDLYDVHSFWKDLSNIFHNAVKYHGDKQTKWIAQMAVSMIKYMNKERKKAENGGQDSSVGGGVSSSDVEILSEKKKLKNKLKIKLKSSPETGDFDQRDASLSPISSSVSPKPSNKLKRQKSLTMDQSSGDEADAVLSSEPLLKKPKLKLKLGTSSKQLDEFPSKVQSDSKPKASSGSVSGDENSVVKAKPTQPKLKLKLSLKSKKSDNASVASTPSSGEKPRREDGKLLKIKSEEIQEVKKLKKKKSSESKMLSPNYNEASASDGSPDFAYSASNVVDKEPKAGKDNKHGSKKSSKSDSSKISVKINPGNRGKELPKAVAASQQQEQAAAASAVTSSEKSVPAPKSVKKNNKLKLKKSISNLSGAGAVKKSSMDTSSSDPTKSRGLMQMSGQLSSDKGKSDSGQDQLDVQLKQCSKVMAGLRLRQQKNIKWFAYPIADKKILPEYNAKIKYPMDMQTLQSNLEKGSYNGNVHGFCLDLRRIFSNALQFNTVMKDSLRPVAIEVLQTAEDLMKILLSNDTVGPQQSCPNLLYCWKLCLDILNTIYKLENSADGQPLALYFFHPVTYYCLGETPPGYSDKVKKPMDFGTVTANLVEGRYQTVESFSADCRLIITNCLTYYDGREDGKIYVEQANKLNECLSQQLDQLSRYDKSPKAASDRLKAKEPNPFPKPPTSLLISIISDLRALKYTDKATKLTQPAMAPYEEPVSLISFPDYTQFVRERMDLQTIERKVKAGGYDMVEDFEYDVNLLFRNFEVYNSRRNAQHAVAMAKFGSRKFRLLLMARIKSFEEPGSMPPPRVERQESVASQLDSQPEKSTSSTSPSPPGKKIKPDSMAVAKKKVVPRISITAVNAVAASVQDTSPVPSNRSKSPNPKKPLVQAPALAKPKSGKPNQPVPLHIAIARVKEGFPIRRAVKTLQSWEADCARFFKELMRHPWISAARPKFIFHVPVPVLFPDLCDTYAAKIKYPMDLTTIECSLLSGNKYTGPEDFVNDVALVFTNAIRFNKDGKDIGDPLSCAYYDASVHLLRYARWLSHEVLSDYVNDSDHTDPSGSDGLPPFSWSLTAGNRNKAREEMVSLVLKEPIDISLEGDRWTWHEAECEKLLKALRHQSDVKYMTFFIAPNYPHDYAAYISKPMDWEKVQRMLKKRQYRLFGDFVEDLRLIFSNAIKYNAKHEGTDNVSGRAYEAAKYMSLKLEAAISKMLLTVSDRLERERIDHANAEREIEAAERAEEAQIRAAWKKELNSNEGASVAPNTSNNVSQKIRNVRRVEQNTDFEIPFFDEEDDGQHESSYFEVVKFQKAMFEKQRQELLNMRKTSKAIGSTVFGRLVQHQLAKQWAEEATQQSKAAKPDNAGDTASEAKGEQPSEGPSVAPGQASSILGELQREDRGPLQMKLKAPKKKAKGKRPLLDFD